MQKIKIGTKVKFRNGRGWTTGRVAAINGDSATGAYAKPTERIDVKAERIFKTKKGAAGEIFVTSRLAGNVERA